MSNEEKKQIKFWSLMILGLAVLVFIIIGFSATEKNGSGIVVNPEIGDWTKGNADATNYLIEYSDFQCPACRYYYEMLGQLKKDFPNDLKIIFRDYPLTGLHANAMLAAQVAEAAGQQNKFWEMHDKLFSAQVEWSGSADAKTIFIKYADDLGLNKDKFQTDIESTQVKEAVQKDVVSGNTIGIEGTPTFFLNGKKIDNPQNYEQFRQLVNQQIKKQ